MGIKPDELNKFIDENWNGDGYDMEHIGAIVHKATLRHIFEELQKKVIDALNTPYDGLVVLTPKDLVRLKKEAGL